MAATRTAKASILVIGQNPLLQALALSHLQGLGYEVQITPLGREFTLAPRSSVQVSHK